MFPNPARTRESQVGNSSVSFSTDIDTNIAAGKVPFEYVVTGLEQSSAESAGFNVRVSARNNAGYGRPSSALNIKVATSTYEACQNEYHQSETTRTQE